MPSQGPNIARTVQSPGPDLLAACQTAHNTSGADVAQQSQSRAATSGSGKAAQQAYLAALPGQAIAAASPRAASRRSAASHSSAIIAALSKQPPFHLSSTAEAGAPSALSNTFNAAPGQGTAMISRTTDICMRRLKHRLLHRTARDICRALP